MENERKNVKILRGVRFGMDHTANLHYIDVVEIESAAGEPEVWTRSLRREGYEDPVTGERIVWRQLPFGAYEDKLEGMRSLGRWAGGDLSEVVLQSCSTLELGPSERERR